MNKSEIPLSNRISTGLLCGQLAVVNAQQPPLAEMDWFGWTWLAFIVALHMVIMFALNRRNDGALMSWAFGLAFSLVLLALLVVSPAAIDMWLSGKEFIERMRMPAWRMAYSAVTYSFSFVVLIRHMAKVEAKARERRLTRMQSVRVKPGE
ncbi:MAG: hypothetical protein DHS20C11_34180 [Lysobacteraceae bacterium]|nr:MAG: hypothetical protein DHS20C11_34180 [Xanthomonadaceae bacterium]